ncbi:MAG: hypothetical protein RJA57_1140 [Bacteroidota bacterium]|jgi:hypothetical protein
MKWRRKSKVLINYVLGPLLFVWLAGSLYRQIERQPGLEAAWIQIRESFRRPVVWNLIAVVLLVGVNWGLEALKWQWSVRSVRSLSFGRSYLAVLAGIPFSVSTPNRIGEFFGRMLYMPEGSRLRTISLTIVGSISQLLITLMAGSCSLLVLRSDIAARQLIAPLWMDVICWGVFLVTAGTLLFYFRISWLVQWIGRIPITRRFSHLFDALVYLKPQLLMRLLFFSGLRFFVFILQYYLLFRLFGVDPGWAAVWWTVSASFLVMSIIPTIAVAELAQRGTVLTVLVGLYSVNELGILLATIGIWFLNLILPAIIGSLLILRMRRIFSTANED